MSRFGEFSGANIFCLVMGIVLLVAAMVAIFLARDIVTLMGICVTIFMGIACLYGIAIARFGPD